MLAISTLFLSLAVLAASQDVSEANTDVDELLLIPVIEYETPIHKRAVQRVMPFSGGMYGKRAPMPFSGGMYGKRSAPSFGGKRASPLPMFSGGMYGKRASLVFDEAKRPVMPFSGGMYGKRSGLRAARGMPFSGGFYG